MAQTATKFPVNVDKTKTERPVEWRPFADLRRQMDRLFDDFQWGSWPSPLGRTILDTEPFWRGETG